MESFTESVASDYFSRVYLNGAFLSAYLGTLGFLFHGRADGDSLTEGSLRRLVTSSDSKRKVTPSSLLYGEMNEVSGAAFLILLTAACVWLNGLAMRREILALLIGLYMKQIVFNSSLLSVDLSLLSYQGTSISKLPVVSPRSRRVSTYSSPDVTEGKVSSAIVLCYCVAAWFALFFTAGLPVIQRNGSAILNSPDTPVEVFGLSGTTLRSCCHMMELLVFGFFTWILGKMLCSIYLLCFIFQQRLTAIESCTNLDDLHDAILLSSHRLQSAETLLTFSATVPFVFLVPAFCFDIYGLYAGSEVPLIATAIWCIGFPMLGIFIKGLLTAVRANKVWTARTRGNSQYGMVKINLWFTKVEASMWLLCYYAMAALGSAIVKVFALKLV